MVFGFLSKSLSALFPTDWIYDKICQLSEDQLDDVKAQILEDKNAFREMLVWYGGVKRKQTEGKYWTGLLHEELKKDTNDVNFISDIRYVEYEQRYKVRRAV